MDPRRNPYAPGAGVKPPEFAGRDQLIEDVDIALDRTRNGLYANDIILLGLRGVGKTVLLNHLHALAKSKDFQTVKFEVPDGSGGHLVRELVPALNLILRKLDREYRVGEAVKLAGAALRNFAAMFRVKYEGFSFGATPAEPAAEPGDLERALPEVLATVATAAQQAKTCIGIFIDEIQYLSEAELSALTRSCHATAQDNLPILLVGTGLPQIAALAGDAKSYAERLFVYPVVGPLDRAAADRVLTEPAERFDVKYTPEALDRIYAETGGYPYFLQTWGKFAWEAAKQSPIAPDDLDRAEDSIRHHLDTSFFRTRFDRCSEKEQQYLRGMAELGPGPHRTGDIAEALGTTSAAVAPIRRGLIDLGMIYAPKYGETAFIVPLFDQFMKRAIPKLDPYKPGRRAT